MEKYLNISELGAMFGLGVQTLHYYDKIGLLQPAYRDSKNGYRKYRFDQIYQLASIRYMRKMGYSIEDIHNFQNSRHPQETIQILKERSNVLRRQWEEWMRIDAAIMRKIQYIEEESRNLDVTSLRIMEFPERHYILIGTESEIYMDDSFYFYPTVVFYEGEKKYFGALVCNEREDTNDMERSVALSSIPAGRYLVGYHKGPYETILNRVEELKQMRPEYHYNPCSVSFNIIDQFVEQDRENYITKIQIQILGNSDV